MKITGPGGPQGPSAPRRTTGPRSGKDAFAPSRTSSTPASSGTTGTGPVAAVGSVEALLALQGEHDEAGARRQATERAFTLLDVLDDLKIALLEGGVPRAKLVRLMDTLKSRRAQVSDPKLEAMLDEVETRAAVELAKYDA
ncbi:MAG: flagellar assembly protein FliX [Oceanicaulis sp.]|uniref:flagellar assembly protein FliX n=1 Tax=Glycocaulis sp. TaxID=1969725 RepID=UPI0025C6A1C0|nr:flagellar assembly protein FliX [Glycocaulis sp.]MCC5981156.1 flagellar assembly protein FliX [Oceanicaulis sp.]MCH8520429.1 flagellar assembly protein FliX [Glycocaulis sp.]